MKRVFILICFLISIHQSRAYQSKGLLLAKIDSLEIRSGEFLYAYKKNRDTTEVLNYDSLNSYLEQYINFKLKVLEAKSLGYDTRPSFQQELAGYISQIRKPYLNNPKTEQRLVKLIHKRMQEEIQASHILIRVESNAPPSDTLKAYMLVDSLRRLVKDENSFAQLARQNSQDGSAKTGGKLGWFTALDMVSPFEDMAYKTKVNTVSGIAKTRFGYHILYITNRRPSKGKLKTSHIFFSNQNRNSATSLALANQVYDSLVQGVEWNKMARKYSDDNRTKMNGGQLPLSRIKQLPDDFMDIAYSLDHIGEISKPSQTQFGWHIVRLDEVEPIPEFGVAQSEIAQNLKRIGRNSYNTEELLNKLKSENGYSANEVLLESVIKSINSNGIEAYNGDANQTIFNIGKKQVRLKEFIEFLPSRKITPNINTLKSFYKQFEQETILSHEDSIAPQKYPEFGYLLKEYEEGLLLFEVMQQKIWNKALEDSLGIKKYHNDHFKNYREDKRFVIRALSSSNKSIIEKITRVYTDNNSSLDSIFSYSLSQKERSLLKIAKRTINANEMPNFETVGLKKGSWVENPETEEVYFIDKVIPSGYSTLDEVRGLVISDFQDYLEKQWIQQLRKKREVRVFKKALKKLAIN